MNLTAIFSHFILAVTLSAAVDIAAYNTNEDILDERGVKTMLREGGYGQNHNYLELGANGCDNDALG